jgi:hypothetical protein
MDNAKRARLTQIALDGLHAREDVNSIGERWTYIFDSDDCISVCYCTWEETEEYLGYLPELDLQWSAERRAAKDSGDVDPSEEELRQWKNAAAQYMANNAMSYIKFVKHIFLDDGTEGFALFSAHTGGAAEDEPNLDGVFNTVEQAQAFLEAGGAIAQDGRDRLSAWRRTQGL